MRRDLNLVLLVGKHDLTRLIDPHIPGFYAVLNGKKGHNDKKDKDGTDDEIHALLDSHSIQHDSLPANDYFPIKTRPRCCPNISPCALSRPGPYPEMAASVS
jgi:hypothetical protein